MANQGNRGPGGGVKRRIRTRVIGVGKTMKLIALNRSKKPIPANWRVVLAYSLRALHDDVPAQLRTRYKISGASVPVPDITIPSGSPSDSALVVVLSGLSDVRRQQAALLEFALRTSDVLIWPVPSAKISRGTGGTTRVATDLRPVDDGAFTGTIRHYLNVMRLREFGIDPSHIVTYEVRQGKSRFLGIRTTCGRRACFCGERLEANWPKAWEMHY